MTDKIVVLVTCGSAREARKIARAVVEARLSACANILASPVHSVYRWKGTVESAKEFLLIIKTTKARFPKLKAEVKHLHSYDVPEIIALPIAAGASNYLAWISDSVAPPRRTNKKPPQACGFLSIGRSGNHGKIRSCTANTVR